MNEVLYLNKKKVDILPSKITRKIRIADIADIVNLKSSFSYTFQLAKTSKNKIILDMLGVIGNTSMKPFETVVADYVVENEYLIYNGRAIIKSTGETYSVNLIDGFKSISETLGQKKLVDLPLSDLNHYIDTQAYLDSFANTEGFIYAIANFGTGTFPTIVKVESQAPSIFVHTLFRRIFESNGFSLQGDFFTTNADYLSEVLVAQNGYTIPEDTITTTDKGNAETNTISKAETYDKYLVDLIKFTITDIDLIGVTVSSGEMTFSSAGLYLLQFDIDFSIISTDVSIVVVKNGVNTSYIALEEGSGLTKTSYLYLDIEAGDVVYLNLRAAAKFSDGEWWLNYSVFTDINLLLVSGGSLITPDLYIADITQIAFIKDVIARYGLIVNPIAGTNEFIFEEINNVLEDFSNAEDWSKKVSSISAEMYQSGYAKINKGVYKYPETITKPNNDGEFALNNANAEEVKTILQSPYEIPKKSSGVSVGGYFVYLIKLWSEEASVLTNEESTLKLMRMVKYNTTILAKLYDESPGISFTGLVPYLSLQNMSMQYFFDTYYTNFISMLDNYKELPLQLNLNSNDIYNLDFFRLKYLKQTQKYYYIESVINTAGKISKVNAIELNP